MELVRSFLQALEQYRLLDAGQLDGVRRKLLPHYADDPRGLAAALLKRKLATPLQLNRLFAGRGAELLRGSYVLLERLGEGGMGRVYKARNWKLGRTVALKLIRKELLTNETAVGRFRREMEATAQLDHPNLIRAYDAGEADGVLFIVMEYVDGIDLGRLVREQGPVEAALASDYIRQAALGLQHAHEKGFIHRDIKPPNLLLVPQSGAVKLLDLGLARLQDPVQIHTCDTQLALTQLGVIVGTVDFIAPEQARDSRAVDIRADLYSLGCTFCCLLTGHPPYPGGTPTERVIKHSVNPLPPMRQVPDRVRAVVHRLLAKRPEDRYQTPAELVHALELLLTRAKSLTRKVSPGLLPFTVPSPRFPSEREPAVAGAVLVGDPVQVAHPVGRKKTGERLRVKATGVRHRPAHKPTKRDAGSRRTRRWVWGLVGVLILGALLAIPLLSPTNQTRADNPAPKGARPH